MEMQWFVVYIKTTDEKKILETLTRKKLEYYFPKKEIKATREIAGRSAGESLFPNYILIKATRGKLIELKKVRGIINVVYWLGNPVIINDHEVKLLKQFLTEHIVITAEKIPAGGKVDNVYDTSITQHTKNVMTIKNRKANIVLPTLGYVLFAEAESSKVRLVPAKKLTRRSKFITSKFFGPVVSFNNFLKN